MGCEDHGLLPRYRAGAGSRECPPRREVEDWIRMGKPFTVAVKSVSAVACGETNESDSFPQDEGRSACDHYSGTPYLRQSKSQPTVGNSNEGRARNDEEDFEQSENDPQLTAPEHHLRIGIRRSALGHALLTGWPSRRAGGELFDIHQFSFPASDLEAREALRSVLFQEENVAVIRLGIMADLV